MTLDSLVNICKTTGEFRSTALPFFLKANLYEDQPHAVIIRGVGQVLLDGDKTFTLAAIHSITQMELASNPADEQLMDLVEHKFLAVEAMMEAQFQKVKESRKIPVAGLAMDDVKIEDYTVEFETIEWKKKVRL